MSVGGVPPGERALAGPPAHCGRILQQHAPRVPHETNLSAEALGADQVAAGIAGSSAKNFQEGACLCVNSKSDTCADLSPVVSGPDGCDMPGRGPVSVMWAMRTRPSGSGLSGAHRYPTQGGVDRADSCNAAASEIGRDGNSRQM